MTNWVVADVTLASNRIVAFGTLNVYCLLRAVKVITLLVIVNVTGAVPVSVPRSSTLLNHIYLPAVLLVLLKLEVIDPFILQLTACGGLIVIITFWVLVQPFAVNV